MGGGGGLGFTVRRFGVHGLGCLGCLPGNSNAAWDGAPACWGGVGDAGF